MFEQAGCGKGRGCLGEERWLDIDTCHINTHHTSEKDTVNPLMMNKSVTANFQCPGIKLF